MKNVLIGLCISALSVALVACGSDEKTTVIHERPVVVAPAVSGADRDAVEATCKHGYDNATHSCY